MNNEQQAQKPVAWVDLKIGDEILPGDRYLHVSTLQWGFYGENVNGRPQFFDTYSAPTQRRYTAPPLRDLSKDEICELYFNNPTDDIFVFAKDVLAKAREKE